MKFTAAFSALLALAFTHATVTVPVHDGIIPDVTSTPDKTTELGAVPHVC